MGFSHHSVNGGNYRQCRLQRMIWWERDVRRHTEFENDEPGGCTKVRSMSQTREVRLNNICKHMGENEARARQELVDYESKVEGRRGDNDSDVLIRWPQTIRVIREFVITIARALAERR